MFEALLFHTQIIVSAMEIIACGTFACSSQKFLKVDILCCYSTGVYGFRKMLHAYMYIIINVYKNHFFVQAKINKIDLVCNAETLQKVTY